MSFPKAGLELFPAATEVAVMSIGSSEGELPFRDPADKGEFVVAALIPHPSCSSLPKGRAFHNLKTENNVATIRTDITN